MLYKGVGKNGNFIAYILSNERQVKLMRGDVESGTPRPLIEYGRPLYIDFIDEPDAKAEAFLQKWCAENKGSLN